MNDISCESLEEFIERRIKELDKYWEDCNEEETSPQGALEEVLKFIRKER